MPRKWSVQPRLFFSMIVSGLTFLFLPTQLHIASRLLCTWDTGMICFLALTWSLMLRATPDHMRQHAQLEDQGRVTILSLITAAACASLLAIGFILKDSKGASGNIIILHVTLAVVTIVGSWLLVHTIFALHYARGYYQDDKSLKECQEEELDFPGDIEPDYWDFMYFSFVIGMTSQVSDVEIASRSIRRIALLHGILSFFFNTTIVAMTINIIAGLI